MSILFTFIVIILTSTFYFISSKKLKKIYCIISTTAFFFIILIVSGLWWFFPKHIEIIDSDNLQILVQLSSGKEITSNHNDKIKWIDLVQNTKFFKGNPEYLFEHKNTTTISFFGKGIMLNKHNVITLNIYLLDNQKYGIADINGKRYHFNPAIWKKNIQQIEEN